MRLLALVLAVLLWGSGYALPKEKNPLLRPAVVTGEERDDGWEYVTFSPGDQCSVTYPRLDFIEDAALRDKVNMRLREEILPRAESFTPKESDFYFASGKIMFCNEQFVSVLYDAFWMYAGMPHPQDIAFSINLNLETGEPVPMTDFYHVTDAFPDAVLRPEYIHTEPGDRLGKARREALMQFLWYPPEADDFRKQGDPGSSSLDVYYTKDYIGFKVATAYVVGSQLFFEVPYEDLAEFLIAAE